MESLFAVEGERDVTWVKLEDDIFQHPKILAAGPQASFLFIASVCWSGHNLTNGHIPAYALRRLAADIDVSETQARELADKLVEVRAPGSTAGLWEFTADGWLVHDWEQWQTGADDRKVAEAEAARKRQLRHRQKLSNPYSPLLSVTPGLPDGNADQGQRHALEVEVEREVENNPPYPPTWVTDFDCCWEVYPRKLNRKAALRCYVATRRRGNRADDLLLATQGFAKVMAAEGREWKLIKHGSTFFGPDEPWTDYLPGGEGLKVQAKPNGTAVKQYTQANGTTINTYIK